MTENTCHHIKVQQFEGPLDLLLQLIEKKELEISTISLAEVTDQYLSLIDDLKNVSQEVLINFLAVASKLILIKSKALLPVLDDNEEIEEDAKDLARRLSEYKIVREISKKIENIEQKKNINFSRLSDKKIVPFFFMPRNVTLKVLHKYFDNVFKELCREINVLPKKEIKELIKLEDKINELRDKLTKGRLKFKKFLSNDASKVEIVISFLAMLHLLKRRVVVVNQGELFGDIEIINNQ